ncbi:MAG TPA: 30S ribosome-binding factor RbfA [Steroidobacteraceae bacterium]|nr:30S ribosome-binding factor RbfA [Steroidobacteraceae bacterium]
MAARTSARAARIAAQMQRSLAELLRRGVKDPRVGNVTITTVVLAGDLSLARIQFLPFAAAHAADEVLAGLRSAAGYLRSELARELKLRHVPRLEFQLDTDLERAQRLTHLIDSAVKADRQRGAAPPAADEDA